MFSKAGAILLAAGSSRRMGKTKQLLPLGGEPAVVQCVKQMISAGIDDIVVVLGHDRWRIAAALSDLPVCMVVNENQESEMIDSVRIGISALPGYVTGFLVALCDHPLVTESTYRLLASSHDLNSSRILLPEYEGRGGHPTLFPALMIDHIDSGMPMNHIMQRFPHQILRIPVDDPGVTCDMDTELDYRRLLSMAQQKQQVASV